MTARRNVQPPLLYRCLVRVASWIVPRRARREWRAKWDSSLWDWLVLLQRGELAGKVHADLLRYVWGSFREALWLRVSPRHLRWAVRSPVFLLASAAALVAVMAALTAGFSGTRALFQPIPVADPDRLVSVRYTGSLDQPFGVPPRLVPLWRAQSKLLADLAGYVRQPYWQARVTTNFFDLLGTRPAIGRAFRPGDGDVALLDHDVWRTVYGRDPHVIGKTVTLDGREFTVIGVLPAGFWAVSRYVQVWTPMSLEPRPGPDAPFLIGAVGRLKPGADASRVRYELLNLARAAGRYLPRPPEVVPFQNVPDRPLSAVLPAALFALAVGIVLLAMGRLLWLRHGWRYRGFLAAKTLFAIGVPLLLWIEMAAALRARLPETAFRVILAGPVLTMAFILGSALAVWWSFADQRRRCPVCLHLMALPVTIGSWSSVLDPVTTELLCDAGHGALSLPETESGSGRWTGMDSSWSDLFNPKP